MGDLSEALMGSDLEWYEHTEGGFCGGCGNDVDDCHPGHPCGDVPGFCHNVCDLCPDRVATGEVRTLRKPEESK